MAVAAGRKYPDEIRERAVRLLNEAKEQDAELSWNAAYERIGNLLSVHPTTLRAWLRQSQIDAGVKSGATTTENAEIKKLKREVNELKRANEILLAASSFFARELDPRLPW